jgi:hypothetical protein
MKKITPFFIYRKIMQCKIALFGNSRPTSFPYISGDTFRAKADHIYDPLVKCQPQDIQKGQNVFVESGFLKEFFAGVHPHIKNHYVLISHNGDLNITEEFLDYIDEKIIHWYAQNVTVSHPKLTPLPIGLENMHYYNNGIVSIFDKARKNIPAKKNRILVCFNTGTNVKERQSALDYLKSHPAADVLYSNNSSRLSYLREHLGVYKFVASPPGNGLDCIRTWEAMYMRAVPIVKKSAATLFFKKIGLPLYVIDEWQELDNLREQDLELIYKELEKSFDHPALWAQYWLTLITSHTSA